MVGYYLGVFNEPTRLNTAQIHLTCGLSESGLFYLSTAKLVFFFFAQPGLDPWWAGLAHRVLAHFDTPNLYMVCPRMHDRILSETNDTSVISSYKDVF